MSRAAELLMNAGAALKEGALDRAAEQVEAALAAEPRLRRETRRTPHSLEELMPLLRRKDAAGPVLRRFRQLLGLSQVQAAEICDVRQDYIAQVEAGRQSMAEAPMRRLLAWAGERGAQALEEGPPPQALLKLRQLLGLTQLSVAAKLGLKEGQVRRMETGNMSVSMPAAEQYRRLAAECGVDLDRLAA